MSVKLSKSQFGAEMFEPTEAIRWRALQAECAYLETRSVLASCYGDQGSLTRLLQLCVDLEDRLHEFDETPCSPILNMTFNTAYLVDDTWDWFNHVFPKHVSTWMSLDTMLAVLFQSGRLSLATRCSWLGNKLIPFLRKEQPGLVQHFEGILEHLLRGPCMSGPSLLAHIGIPDKPVH